jgi:regulator of RNase E activity RraB
MTDQTTHDDPDALLLAQMLEAGSDLSKPHQPEFLFDVENAADVEQLADELVELDFDVTVYEPQQAGELFQVVAKCEMILALSSLQNLSAEFERLAEKHRAVYDGWGAEIVE